MFDAFVPYTTNTAKFKANCFVQKNGSTLGSGDVTGYYYANDYASTAGTTFSYSSTLTLAANDHIDFLVRQDYGGQSAGAQITISSMATPEPGSIVLLITGSAGVLAYAWRKRK
jgi:hypothetical protein